MLDLFGYKEKFEDFYNDYLIDFTSNKYIYDSLLYSLKSGGKRLRPWIIYSIGSEYNLNEKNLLLSGLALEILHTSSLIHDDLPDIDNSDLRRGLATNHLKFDNHTAILAGDYGFIYPQKILHDLNLDEIRKNKILKIFTENSLNLFEGEMYDVAYEKYNLSPTYNELENMYKNKTGALFGLSFAIPFIMNDLNFMIAYEMGIKFGISFQILDDLKDLYSDEKTLGKNISKDQNKLTLIKLLGIKKSEALAEELYNDSIEFLKENNLNKTAQELLNLKSLIKER